jgi:hypothetical protein
MWRRIRLGLWILTLVAMSACWADESAAPEAQVPGDAWVTVDGVQWATNGHVLVRRGGILPAHSTSHAGWRRDLASEQMAPVLTVPAKTTGLEPVRTFSDNGVQVAEYRRESDGEHVHLDASYTTVLTGRLVQGGSLSQVFSLDDAGGVQAVVMPRTP